MHKDKSPRQQLFDIATMCVGFMVLYYVCAFTAAYRQNHHNYVPGGNLPRAVRDSINALGDSVLVARWRQYDALRDDYDDQRMFYAGDSLTRKYNWDMDLVLHNPSRKAFPDWDSNQNKYRVRDYHKFLRRYERDSINARYRQLYKGIMRGK